MQPCPLTFGKLCTLSGSLTAGNRLFNVLTLTGRAFPTTGHYGNFRQCQSWTGLAKKPVSGRIGGGWGLVTGYLGAAIGCWKLGKQTILEFHNSTETRCWLGNVTDWLAQLGHFCRVESGSIKRAPGIYCVMNHLPFSLRSANGHHFGRTGPVCGQGQHHKSHLHHQVQSGATDPYLLVSSGQGKYRRTLLKSIYRLASKN